MGQCSPIHTGRYESCDRERQGAGAAPLVILEIVTIFEGGMPSALPRSEAWRQTTAILRVLAILLGVAAALGLAFALRKVLLLLIVTIFFSYLIAPLVDLLQRPQRADHRPWLPRAAAVGLTYAVLFGTLGVVLAFAIPGLGHQMGQLGSQAPALFAKLSDRVQGFLGGDWAWAMPVAARKAIDRALTEAGPQAAGWIEGAVVYAAGCLRIAPWAVLVPVLGFFLLADAPALQTWLVRTLPRVRRPRGRELFDEVSTALARFIRAQVLACLIVAVASTAGLVVLQIPYALLLGALSGVLEFVPVAGPALFLTLACLVASTAGQLLSTLCFLVALRVTQDYLIYPKVLGRGLHLPPVAIILVLVCGAELDGVVGLFMAVPFLAIGAAALRVLKRELGTASLVATLLSFPSEPRRARAEGSPEGSNIEAARRRSSSPQSR